MASKKELDKQMLNLDSLLNQDLLSFVYKGEEYSILPTGLLPFNQQGKLRKAFVKYREYMTSYEDVKAMKLLLEIYVPTFPLDEVDTMTQNQVSALMKLITPDAAAKTDELETEETYLDPK